MRSTNSQQNSEIQQDSMKYEMIRLETAPISLLQTMVYACLPSHHTLMGFCALVASSGPCDDIKTFNGTVDRSYCYPKPESSLLKHETLQHEKDPSKRTVQEIKTGAQ